MRCQRTLLELGAGTGIVSCRIAEALGTGQDTLIATDLPEVYIIIYHQIPGLTFMTTQVCPLLENNVRRFLQEADHSDTVVVRPLAWGDEEHSMLIASELLSTAGINSPRTLSHIICSDLVRLRSLDPCTFLSIS
jgi:hypothetical protein